ncbi:hypothetical protein [Meiothermus hypogaeus]|uniref:Uncharacterized protein n=2 Tax=Meiothermus hypogaeus TaxID=884155 RepID=A0A511R0G0_9DEIN|nr:hypothetical protein [Meiothermus hypogaeus]RIH77564.1 hypothetical protein Mhypo_01946 [Meiothermus hypogaeus]GEM83098.1 hypothetical protein MHY01S_12640 [Meiothermus hypogaeus NBRC 106114]
MRHDRIVFLGERIIQGDEIDSDEFPDVETFRRCAAQWGGPENVLVLRNAIVSNGALEEKLEYLLINRTEIRALGVGGMRLSGFEAMKP